MVSFFYIFALLAVGLPAFSQRPTESGPTERPSPLSRNGVVLLAVLCTALCAAFALQTALTDRAALSQQPLPGWFFRVLPLFFFAPDPPFNALPEQSLVEWTQILAVLESGILLAIYFVVRRADCRRPSVLTIAALAAFSLAAIAFHSSVTCVDLYLYIAHALLWPHQYAPPPVHFSGDDGYLHYIWGMPILPSAYGPLWNLIAAGAIAVTHSLWQQALAIRILGLAAIVTCIFCVRRLLGPSAATLLFAINPALYDRFLMHANNDLSGVAFVLLAAIARRRTWLAIVLVAAAGTVKLPLLLSGLIVFWDRPSLRERLLPATGAFALGLAASLAFGGIDYFRALQSVYAAYDHSPHFLQQALHLALVVVAFAAVGLALWRQRFFVGAGWSFVSLGQYALPQYLAWCLPYVLLGRANPLPFLIAWPILDYALTLEFQYTPFFRIEQVVLIVAVVAALGFAVLSNRRRRQLAVT